MSTTIETSAPSLRKTALNAMHRRLGAKMVDFGGWDMPVEYSGLISEHLAVRTGVGVFDVSHMGDILIRGKEALEAVQYISMNDASKLQEGQAHYSALLYPQGTFVDDVIVHKLSDHDYLLVINAGTREKDYNWVRQNAGRFHGHITDVGDYYTQLAIQGPQAAATLQKLTNVDLSTIKGYWFKHGTICGLMNTLIARTGYTGEDGFEIYVPSDVTTSERVWNEVFEAGKEFGIVPCGLGARNTLRLESKMALYGQEISETINVWEAELGRYAKLDKGDFVGRDALIKAKEKGLSRIVVGLEMIDRGIGRDGYKLFDDQGAEVGYITSGSPAPFLKKNIALAYVPPTLAEIGTPLWVEIRQNKVKARVVPTPFYKRVRKSAPANAAPQV
ncbi:MAG: glycine cleavage system aminomethyltransferase GcvT [Acidobacteriaceae bacterium]